MTFADKLLHWYQNHGRDLPWRKTADPYIIWLSEIILQQTRVEQGLPYFEVFSTSFPTVQNFANAREEDILRYWQGLGYYSRARNMHKAAKQVMDLHDGVFPTKYEELIKLQGVGEYTAAAISSFAANEAHAVVDGNVFRVLSRVFGLDMPINSTEGKKVFKELAYELLPKDHAGQYNHAIMDFGATQCKPRTPLCEECILRLDCKAYADGRVEELPIKLKGKVSRDRYFHYFIIEKEGYVLMSKRNQGDIWANLYEFPLIETSSAYTLEEIYNHEQFKQYFDGATIQPVSGIIKHVLSHQNIYARFYALPNLPGLKEKKSNWEYIMSEKIDTLAKHKLIFSFWDKYYNS
jgi:A/G-specific adenine glycosylase